MHYSCFTAEGVAKGYSHKEDDAVLRHHGYDAEREIKKAKNELKHLKAQTSLTRVLQDVELGLNHFKWCYLYKFS